jgi:hypothetical protein
MQVVAWKSATIRKHCRWNHESRRVSGQRMATIPNSTVDQDVGNIVALEHINLNVPDLESARLFYGEGLGLTQDPGTLGSDRGGLGVIWYNIGQQQLHICHGAKAQLLPPGSAIGIVLPDINKVTAVALQFILECRGWCFM